jgi:hypothetical protein
MKLRSGIDLGDRPSAGTALTLFRFSLIPGRDAAAPRSSDPRLYGRLRALRAPLAVPVSTFGLCFAV